MRSVLSRGTFRFSLLFRNFYCCNSCSNIDAHHTRQLWRAIPHAVLLTWLVINHGCRFCVGLFNRIKLSDVRGVKMKCVLHVSCVCRNKLVKMWVSVLVSFRQTHQGVTSTHHDTSVYFCKPISCWNGMICTEVCIGDLKKTDETWSNIGGETRRVKYTQQRNVKAGMKRSQNVPQWVYITVWQTARRLNVQTLLNVPVFLFVFFLVWTFLWVSSLTKHPCSHLQCSNHSFLLPVPLIRS